MRWLEVTNTTRKPADRQAQISPVGRTNTFLICALQSPDILRQCLLPHAQPVFYSQYFLVILEVWITWLNAYCPHSCPLSTSSTGKEGYNFLKNNRGWIYPQDFKRLAPTCCCSLLRFSTNGVYSSLFRAQASGGHSKARETRDAQFMQKFTLFSLVGFGPAQPRVCECPPPQIPLSQSPF